MKVVYYSIAQGRPIREPRRKGSTVTWCAWWSDKPSADQCRTPDAHGGARSREEVLEAVLRASGANYQPEAIQARWCHAWRRAQRAEQDARANEFVHAVQERMRTGARVKQLGVQAPPWSVFLGLPWPAFTDSDVSRCFRQKAFKMHPDRGGNHDVFLALGRARDKALQQLSMRRDSSASPGGRP